MSEQATRTINYRETTGRTQTAELSFPIYGHWPAADVWYKLDAGGHVVALHRRVNDCEPDEEEWAITTDRVDLSAEISDTSYLGFGEYSSTREEFETAKKRLLAFMDQALSR